jgi:signal transduction histidine kinase
MILTLHRNITEMAALLQQLQSYSSLIERGARPALQAFEAQLLLDDLVSGYAPLAEAKGLRLEAQCDPTLGVVVGDRLKVAQITNNLLSNSVKYGKSPERDAGVIRLEFVAEGVECWRIVVSDTGIGISDEDVQRIFDEFYRVAPSSQVPGTGLGLAIVKGLVDVLDGSVSVRSELGRGTKFEVTLPKV